MGYERKEKGGSLKELIQSQPSAKTLTSHSCEMSQPWGTCRKVGMLHTAHRRRAKLALKTVCTQTFCPHFFALWWRPWAYALGVGQEIRHPKMDWKRTPEMSRHKVFSSPQICINSEHNSENRDQDKALFWIHILTVQPQLSQKGKWNRGWQKGISCSQRRCHHGLFTVSVTMATT